MPNQPTVFADGIIEASVTFGVVRITLAQTGSDGKPMPCGQLVVPLAQLPAMANGLMTLLKQIENKVKQAQAAPAPVALEAAPEATPDGPAPSVPGAFRFGA